MPGASLGVRSPRTCRSCSRPSSSWSSTPRQPGCSASPCRRRCSRPPTSSPMLFLNRRIIMDRAAELRMAAIYQWPETAEEGGFMGYGPRFLQVFRQRARIVARIFGGAKPADLPIEQPTTFELVINLKTAKLIGHEMPAGLVLRADKVIE